MPDFIEIDNASFTYPSVKNTQQPVLSNINLHIHEGEFIALVGANGSGKSTLSKLLNALLIPDSGRVLISGLDTRDRSHHAQIRAQVGMVFQRPQDQIVATTVEEDVAFGPGNLGLDSHEIRARVDEALSNTGMSGYRARPSYLLSAGETQRLALAGVLAMRPRCIIFDETTAMLDPAGREMVMAQVKDLHQHGITIILITHLMQEAAHAEQIILLQSGRIILDDTPKQVFLGNYALASYGLDWPPVYKACTSLRKLLPGLPNHILHATDLLQALPIYSGKAFSFSETFNREADRRTRCVEIKDLSFTYLRDTPLAHQALENLNLEVIKGEIQSLIGSTGSGKSTLLQHINGLIRPQSGSILAAGFDLSDKDLDVKSLRRKTVLAFQQPEDQIFEQFVGDEIAYAPRHLGYNGKIKNVVEKAMQAVGLDFASYKDRLISTLSGGERRKVALASILAVDAEIILLDEPLSGLDPQSSIELIHHLRQIHDEGKTLLIATHQYEELIPILDRISVLHKGKDIMHGETDPVFSQIHTMERAGLRAPLSALIARQLRKNGWPIAESTASLPSIERQLAILVKGVSL